MYAMHARWLAEVLGPGDSLFTPGRPVWTREHLDELEQGFVARPDTTPGRRYEEKLRGRSPAVALVDLASRLQAAVSCPAWHAGTAVRLVINSSDGSCCRPSAPDGAAVGQRCEAEMLLERPGEVALVKETGLQRDLRDAVVGVCQPRWQPR